MSRLKTGLSLWGPPVAWMLVLFLSSGTPSSEIPGFGAWDFLIKKGGHMMGYAVLALLLRRALGWNSPRPWAAWPLAVLYALADEFHQSFVPGRHPSFVDVFLFDGGGAALALLISAYVPRLRRQQS